jgi:uncharacterized membrane protein
MAKKPVFVYIGVYNNPVLARGDLDIVYELHADKVIGSYDAAVATKELDGSVRIEKHEKATQHGAWTGIAVGAVVGIIFPPAMIGAAAVGGVAGGLIGHFWRGMSRKDVHELGEMLDAGQALLIVVGQDKLTPALDKAQLKADKHIEKQVDMDGEELDRQLADAKKDLAKS